jgi:hypothetical protein
VRRAVAAATLADADEVVTVVLDPAGTRVTIEVHAAGLFSAAAHDLRIAAEGASGESADGTSLVARFPVARFRVLASRRHGTRDWHDPSPSDAAEIEERIRKEIFPGASQVEVVGSAEGGRAQLTVRAPGGSQRVTASLTLEDTADKTRVRGACDLSLRALGTGKVRVPLGAIKLEDAVRVEFDVALKKEA